MKLFNLPARVFLRDRFILIVGGLAGGLNLLAWLLLAIKIPRSTESIILRSNIYFGPDLIGAWYRVFLAPLLGLLIFGLNFLLAYWFYPVDASHLPFVGRQAGWDKKSRLLAYFLVGAGAAVNFFLLIGALTIIFINL
ncbi:MAG: hypothetical protein V1684_03095 [bacterium]